MLPLCSFASLTTRSRPNITNYISVRWKRRPRKPLYLGMGKTKLFKIPERKAYPEDEQIELKRMMEIYDRHMRAFKNFMSADSCSKMEKDMEAEQLVLVAEESRRKNAEWNEDTAFLRMQRLESEKEKLKEQVLKQTMADRSIDAYIQSKAEELVLQEIEESKNFVTEENLDEMVEKCLSSVHDYNSAIDLRGNVYKGTSGNKVTGIMIPNQPNDLDKINEVTTDQSHVA